MAPRCDPPDLQDLPAIPGGWCLRHFDVGDASLRLAVAADPDQLLDEERSSVAVADDGLPYWALVWPAAVHMASAVQQSDWRADTRVLEVGSGLGLVGLAALTRGLNVVLSDIEPRAIAAARYNAHLNGVEAEVRYVDWRDPPDCEFDLILGCDVLYALEHHQPLLDLLQQTVTPDGVAWLGDPGRSPTSAFIRAARGRGLRVTVKDQTGKLCQEPLRGEFQLVELRPPDGAE